MFSKLMDNTDKGRYTYPKRVICEVLRELYDTLILECAEERPDIVDKMVPFIEEALVMGLKMNKAMIEHKLSQDFTAKYQDQNQIATKRQERVDLVQKLEQIHEQLEIAGEQTHE